MKTVNPVPEHVDHRRGIDHIGVGVACIIHDGKGRVCLMKRGLKARDEQGKWDICGGAIEFGEQLEDAVRRELQEELCTVPLEIRFLSAYDAHRVFDDTPSHWVQIVFAVQVDPNTVKIGEPHKIAEIGWFTADTLPEPRHSQFHKSMGLAKQHSIIS